MPQLPFKNKFGDTELQVLERDTNLLKWRVKNYTKKVKEETESLERAKKNLEEHLKKIQKLKL